MKTHSLFRTAALLVLTGFAIAQSPVPIGPQLASQDPPMPAAGHGLPGQKPGSEQWLVEFKTRSFDLSEFRNEMYGGRSPDVVAKLVRKYEALVQSDQAGFSEEIEALGGRVTEQYWIVNAAAIEISHSKLDQVKKLANVLRIQPNLPLYPVIKRATSVANHNSDAVNARGFKGAGITCAIVDTGLDAKSGNTGRPHRTFYPEGDLTKNHRLKANKQMGLLPPDNSHPHGTGVAGIAVGGKWGSANGDNGHAPLADIVGYSLSNSSSGSTSLQVIAKAWQTVAADAATFKIKTANNSYTGRPSPLDLSQQALDSAALNADVMIVVAAGNSSSSTRFSQSCANGLAVAATNPGSHTMANFSSRGPLSGDTQRFYPDISGNGVGTIMPRVDNDNSDYTASGTSMASPQVCGAATLIRAQVPALKADETKAILLATALDISTKNPSPPYNTRNAYGMGLVKDDAAMNLALNTAGHGRATVTTTTKTWQKAFPVKQGRTYRAVATWMRQTMTSTNWSNLDVEVLLGTTVIASSKTPRNLYEVAIFRAAQSTPLIMRVTGAFIEKGTQSFAWAFTEGSGPPVQSAYTLFGAGCNGAPQGCKPCFQVNWTQKLASKSSTAKKIGVLEFGHELLNICDVDLYASAKTSSVTVTVSIHAYDSFKGLPGKLLGSGTVQVGTSAGIYSAKLATPVRIPQNDIFVVAFDNADRLNLPVSPTGKQVPHYEWSGTAWGGLAVNTNWQYRVQCDKGQQPPVLGFTGKPVIGQTLTMMLSAARSSSNALLFLGFSKQTWGALPLPFTFAPGCKLLVSGEVSIPTTVSGTGTASVPIPIPNIKDIVGAPFFNQFLVVDPANSLGLVASNAGQGKVGEL